MRIMAHYIRDSCSTNNRHRDCRVTIAINRRIDLIALPYFVPLLKSLIANVLKRKPHLITKFKCMCVTMCSLVMSLFSCDHIKMEVD